MASVAVRSLVCFLFLSAMLAPYVEAKLRCPQIATAIDSCLGYLYGDDDGVPSKCCDGLRFLNAAYSTSIDRQITCFCLKQVAEKLFDFNYTRTGGLPSACEVNIGYKISPSTNCATVK